MTNENIDVVNLRFPDFSIHPQFIHRWSPRSFLQQEVPEEVWMSVLEAARWAPSASNIQPWRFIVARKPEEKANFYNFINTGNREWCEKAPVLVLLISHNLTPQATPNTSHAFDSGTAWGYLALEAHNQGLISHAMAGFDKELARKTLCIPNEYTLHVVIAIGYQGEASQLSETLQAREQPNSRRPLLESIHHGVFENK